jgi:hypothetical protein
MQFHADLFGLKIMFHLKIYVCVTFHLITYKFWRICPSYESIYELLIAYLHWNFIKDNPTQQKNVRLIEIFINRMQSNFI